jgi:hypothetical protein
MLTRMRNYALNQERIGPRTRVALQELDLLDAEVEPIGEGVDPDILLDSEHPRREKLPPGPLFIYTVQEPQPSRTLIELPELLLSELPDVRKAALADVERMVADGTMEVTPRTRSLLAQKHEELLSDDAHRWRPAAIAVYDALEDDYLVALHGVHQSVSCNPVIKESLNAFTPRVLFPKVSSLESLELEVKNPEAERTLLAEVVQSVVAEATTIGDVCAHYHSRLGYLPLAPPYGMGEAVFRWASAHPGADAWTEVWSWARAAIGPLPRYHACSVFVLHPDLIPAGKLPELWHEVMDVVGQSGNKKQQANEDAPWILRRDLAKHYAYHVEAQLPGAEGANIACSAWWLAEKTCTLFPDVPQSAQFYHKNWVETALERSTLVWLVANPLIGDSFIRYMTFALASPWACSLLALMGPNLDQLAPADLAPEVKSRFQESLLANLVSTLPFPAEPPAEATYALETSMCETALKWASLQAGTHRTIVEGIVALGRRLGTVDGLCEALRKLVDATLPDQLAVTMSLKAHAHNNPTIAAPAWEILSDAEWRQKVMGTVDLPVLGLLIEAFSFLAARHQGKWFTLMPQYLAELCEKADDDQRRHDLFLYVLHISLTSDTVSAVRRLLRGQQKAKFVDLVKGYRAQTEAMWAFYPPWVQGRLRALLASLHVQ